MTRMAVPAKFRRRIETAFGERLDNVVVTLSAGLPRGIAALAAGDRISVRPERWAPGSAAFEHLLAHEYAHVVQSRRARAGGAPPCSAVEYDGEIEAAADLAASAALATRPVNPRWLSLARTDRARPVILADISGGESFADTIVAAINTLTHAGAVAVGARVSGKVFANKYGTAYKSIVAGTPAPSPHPHARSWLLVQRILANPFECKIKASPGTDYGTLYDADSVDMDNATGIGGGTTTPKALKDTGARAKIIWSPFPADTINVTGPTSTKHGIVPAYIVLAHELSHADRIMRGTSLLPRVGSISSMPPQASLAAFPSLGDTRVDWEHVEMVGFTVASYAVKDADVVTENEMRGEHGLQPRFNY